MKSRGTDARRVVVSACGKRQALGTHQALFSASHPRFFHGQGPPLACCISRAGYSTCLQSRWSKQAERKEEGRKDGGREGIVRDPEFRAFLELPALPASQGMPPAREVTGMTAALLTFARALCPSLAPSQRERSGDQDTGLKVRRQIGWRLAPK